MSEAGIFDKYVVAVHFAMTTMATVGELHAAACSHTLPSACCAPRAAQQGSCSCPGPRSER